MARALSLVGEVPAPARPSRFALGRKGFRPFFLLASLCACTFVPLWLLVLAGVLAPPAHLVATTWHAHEMIFGFAGAVIAGFLLTAVGNWTGRETAVGGHLFALATVWLAGRVVMTAPLGLSPLAIAVVDVAFLPLLAATLARPLLAARATRNLVMLVILGALSAANVVVHAAPAHAHTALVVALDVIVLLALVIAGRVLPMFTRNATGATDVRSFRPLERATLAAMALTTVLDALSADGRLVSAAAGVTALLAVARASRWGTRHTARHPLLWILHAGYAWIPIGLLLRATTPASGPALHALTVGALGALTLGMMVRVALGHTGRPLVAPRGIVVAFVLVSIAAVVRVFGPLLAPDLYLPSLHVAGTAWALAFAIHLAFHAPVLLEPRVDGKPG